MRPVLGMLDWLLFEPTSPYTTMFSGIIASVARITTLTLATMVRQPWLTVEAGSLSLDDVELGDSSPVNGVCLTVVERKTGNVFCVDVRLRLCRTMIGLPRSDQSISEKSAPR